MNIFELFNVVRELYGVMAARGAAGGYVVTSGWYTDEAKEFASGRNIELIDGPALGKMINSVQPTERYSLFKKPALLQNVRSATV